MKKIYLLFLTVFAGITINGNAQNKALKLWYEQPAERWEETLPLGNGRLGMMPNGGVYQEKIVLNDITLWSGSPQDANNYEAYKKLPQIRKLLAEGKNNEAQALIDESFICKGKGSAGIPFGCFQVLGQLQIDFDYKLANNVKPSFENYNRALNLENAIAVSSYKLGHVTYTREYFTSFGNDVSIVRLKADKPRQLNLKVSLSREERSSSKTQGNQLQLYGQLDNGTDGKGMQYIARVEARHTGGTLSVNQNIITITDASEVILYLSAGTDFKNPSYKEKTAEALAVALKKSYAAEKKEHIASYQRLFNRLSLDLGPQSKDQFPTDKRLIAFHNKPQADNGLAVLFYQYGRYLSISSTRVGILPPNLQGLWANQIQTPWNGDYHLDVNVQMNHWPLEVSNLSELNLPLAELVKGMVKPGERTAKAYYNAEGWVAHVITNVWGFTEPGESASWGATKVGSGWLCNNLWEHYAFGNDRAYLEDIYPVLKGSAQFYSSMLIEDQTTGWLVTSPSSSPENTFYLPDGKTASICNGPTIDNQIIRELFGNVITAARLLDKDAELVKALTEKMLKLPPVGQVAKDGRLMEWLEDYKETDPQHRHISHLYGVYPASLITPEATPELAEASKKTLEVRGDDGPSWSIAYKLLFWARLKDGNRAYKLFTELMRPTIKTDINYGAGGGIYPNLLSAGPPFQIDGNFGAAAGIAEMLIQSHAGFIEFLPSLPDAWKKTGSVKGIKARGNYTIDFAWEEGKVTAYRIASPQAGLVKVLINGMKQEARVLKL